MIAERIYNGETAEQLGISAAEYADRRSTLERYLQTTGGAFDPAGFLTWLQTDAAGDRKEGSGPCQPKRQAGATIRIDRGGGCSSCGKAGTQSAAQMARSLAREMARFARSGFKTARDYQKRLAVCEACAEFIAGRRCRICGCFMDVKARMATTDCPLGKWSQETDEKTEVV